MLERKKSVDVPAAPKQKRGIASVNNCSHSFRFPVRPNERLGPNNRRARGDDKTSEVPIETKADLSHREGSTLVVVVGVVLMTYRAIINGVKSTCQTSLVPWFNTAPGFDEFHTNAAQKVCDFPPQNKVQFVANCPTSPVPRPPLSSHLVCVSMLNYA